jgi:hypothetical protein
MLDASYRNVSMHQSLMGDSPPRVPTGGDRAISCHWLLLLIDIAFAISVLMGSNTFFSAVCFYSVSTSQLSVL